MKKKILVHKASLDNVIREFLKENDVSSLDMIKFLSKSMCYYIQKYNIPFMDDFVEISKKFEKNECAIESSIFVELGMSLELIGFIQQKLEDKKL